MYLEWKYAELKVSLKNSSSLVCWVSQLNAGGHWVSQAWFTLGETTLAVSKKIMQPYGRSKCQTKREDAAVSSVSLLWVFQVPLHSHDRTVEQSSPLLRYGWLERQCYACTFWTLVSYSFLKNMKEQRMSLDFTKYHVNNTYLLS